MSDEAQIEVLLGTFFNTPRVKTSHETLANDDGEGGVFYTHVCFHTMKRALVEMVRKKKDAYCIVETGCSSHGTRSTLLWDNVVNAFGGKVLSVDVDDRAVESTNQMTTDQTVVAHSDSLTFLPTLTETIDLLYLDSYDVDFLNPRPSAEHHRQEFNCVKHLLGAGSIVLIDDTPRTPEWLDNGTESPMYATLKEQFDGNMAGKGSLVHTELQAMGAVQLMHQYQSLWIVV